MLRLVVVATLLVLFAAERPAHLARLGLASLPDIDAASRVADLRAQGQFGDALLVAGAALEWTEGPAREKLLEQERLTRDEQASWMRRAKEVGLGALTGRGDSLERLIGAVGSDLFLVGDDRTILKDLAAARTKIAREKSAQSFSLKMQKSASSLLAAVCLACAFPLSLVNPSLLCRV
jgi:hypothetical protein